MRIKKDIYHIIFFDFVFEVASIVLVALGFFLGFELTINNILIYLLINCSIVLFGLIVLFLYVIICKTYYEFENDSIKIIKQGNIIKEINYNQIKYCEYYRFVTLLLGDSKGGKLIVYYLDNDTEKNMEISFSKKLIKKIRFNKIYVK